MQAVKVAKRTGVIRYSNSFEDKQEQVAVVW